GTFTQAITLNVITNSLSGYANGVPYTLLNYTGGSIQGAAGFNAFILGTIAGTNSRTNGFLSDTGHSITLTPNADNPKWTGFNNNTGLISSQWAANNNAVTTWKLISASTPTAYLEGDTILFDDSAFSTTVTINDGDVHPSSVTFNNTVAYNLGSPS